MTKYIARALQPIILEALQSSPIVFINGPRQAGKSTLVRQISAEQWPADYVTFDNISSLTAATEDPEGFITSFQRPVILDEVQRVPSLFLALKKHIDEIRYTSPVANISGRFLLTGSANILAMPLLSAALVGRMEIHTLYPLSAQESLGLPSVHVIHKLFEETFSYQQLDNTDLDTIIQQATFPEIAYTQDKKRFFWFESYLSTVLQRDVQTLAEIEKMTALPNLLRLLASRVGSLLNDASLARDAGLNQMTCKRYRVLLNLLFLSNPLVPWYRNIGKRFVKAPKIYLTDTALLCHILGISLKSLKSTNPQLYGSILENFVASELTKQLSYTHDGTLYYLRTQDNKEIDFIIERRDGGIIGIEVKSRMTVNANDFDQLRWLQASIGKDFIRGIVLYSGAQILPFGSHMFAIPISYLWHAKNTYPL